MHNTKIRLLVCLNDQYRITRLISIRNLFLRSIFSAFKKRLEALNGGSYNNLLDPFPVNNRKVIVRALYNEHISYAEYLSSRTLVQAVFVSAVQQERHQY